MAVVIEADRAIARTIGSTPKEAAEALVQRAFEAIASEHQVGVDSLVIVKPGSLPRTSSGKLQRSLCRCRMLAGELEELYAVSKPI